jgi:hypothetical protein
MTTVIMALRIGDAKIHARVERPGEAHGLSRKA